MRCLAERLTNRLVNIVGENAVSKLDPSRFIYPTKHAFDVRQRDVLSFKPEDGRDIYRALIECKKERVPVTPVGSLTSNRGQAFPVYGGVVFEFSNMKAVKDLDMDGLTVTVLPGVTYEELNANIVRRGFRVRVTPLRSVAATVGGFIAEGGIGIGSLKYGPASNDMLHMNFVNPYVSFMPLYYALSVYPEQIPYINSEPDPFVSSGGGKVTPYALGYNLKETFTGSEGSIGLMTQATFAVRPAKIPPSARLFEFDSLSDAWERLRALGSSRVLPYHLALVDAAAMNILHVEVPAKFLLLVALDDEDSEKRANAEKTHDAILGNEAKKLDQAVADKSWKAMLNGMVFQADPKLTLTEEVRIPTLILPKAWELVKQIGQKWSIDLALSAHATSGVESILYALFAVDKNDLDAIKKFEIAASEIREKLVMEKGMPYGLGLVNLGILDWKFPVQASLVRIIKRRLDPLGLLNPGKMFSKPPTGT